MVFFSTYKLYKRGTSQVVAWLGKTAAQFGYELSSVDTSKQEEKAGYELSSVDTLKHEEKVATSKQKMRKMPKSNNNGKTPSDAESKVTKYKVSIKELPMLATVISEHFQELEDSKIPPSILKVLKDVIHKRKQWARGFGLPDANTLASNVQHKHFVTVLEDVYAILEGIPSTLQVDQGQTTVVEDNDRESTSTEEIALSNLFSILDIYEPANEDNTGGQEGAILGPTPTSSSHTLPTPTYELQEEINEEEIYFMIYCFFEDFLVVRKHVSQSWSDYRNGSLDLVAVAVTTNVALEMLERAETALIASLPKKYNLTGYRGVGDILLIVVAYALGVDPNFRHERDDVINVDLKDISDFICLPVYIILSSFLPAVLGEGSLPVLKPGHFGVLDLTGQQLSWRDKFRQNSIALFEILPEFCLLNKIEGKFPLVDKLSCGVMEMVRTKEIPIWLVLGCQIYLDIHHTMLSSIGMAHKELQTMGLHVSKTLENYFEFCKGIALDSRLEQNEMALRMIKLEADLWINRDYFAAFKKKLLKSVNLAGSTARPCSLLSRHPLLCGVLLFRQNLRLQEAGVVSVSAGGALPTIMHLYNAVKHEFSEDGFPLWEDVENVIQIQGKERVFVGDYPKNAIEYLKRFALVMGYSCSIFAQNRRGGRHTPQTQTPASSRGPREMTTTSAVADVFRDQYCENETRSEVTFHKIERLLSTSSLGLMECGTGFKRRARQLTTLSFLSALQTHIQADILALNMDYFALHIRSYELLRTIHVRLDPEFRKYVGPDYVEKESQLPFLVGHLFLIATGGAKAAETFKLPGQNKSQVLKKAGELVKELVRKEGNRETERVRTVCHGVN